MYSTCIDSTAEQIQEYENFAWFDGKLRNRAFLARCASLGLGLMLPRILGLTEFILAPLHKPYHPLICHLPPILLYQDLVLSLKALKLSGLLSRFDLWQMVTICLRSNRVNIAVVSKIM